MNSEIVRQVIKELMRREDIKNITELAAKSGVPQPTLSRLFKGTHSTVTVDTLLALGTFFRVTVSHLLGEIPLDPDPRLQRLIADYGRADERGRITILTAAEKEASWGKD